MFEHLQQHQSPEWKVSQSGRYVSVKNSCLSNFKISNWHQKIKIYEKSSLLKSRDFSQVCYCVITDPFNENQRSWSRIKKKIFLSTVNEKETIGHFPNKRWKTGNILWTASLLTFSIHYLTLIKATCVINCLQLGHYKNKIMYNLRKSGCYWH